MKEYVIGVLNFFDNDNKLYRVKAENENGAIAEAIILDCKDDETKKSMREWIDDCWNLEGDTEDILEQLFNCDYSVSKPIEL